MKRLWKILRPSQSFAHSSSTRGGCALTDEQLAAYDVLHANMTRERRAKDAPTTVTKFQTEELHGIQFQMKEGFHDKRQCPLWIVQLSSRVDARSLQRAEPEVQDAWRLVLKLQKERRRLSVSA